MSVLNPTETDYRAWIAIIWSVAFFTIIVSLIWNHYSVNDIVIISAIFNTPLGMIIAFYYGVKALTTRQQGS